MPQNGTIENGDFNNVIQVRNLVRRYGDFTAVDNVDLDVGRGEIYGFLGPNGAGKTTTISMLTTLLKPTSGTALVDGRDIVEEQAAVRKAIGMVFQEQSIDEKLTARENLDFHAVLYGVPRRERKKRAAEVLQTVDLQDRADQKIEEFSGGMKRRLEIARGLLHTPRVLFLDEPTQGLDPQTRNSIWEHLLRLREESDVTVFMTTHYMDEAEYCDRIAIMDGGKVVEEGAPEDLKGRVGSDIVSVTPVDESAAADLRSFAEDKGIPVRDGGSELSEMYFEVENGTRFVPRLLGDLPAAVEAVSVRRPTLDDVFLNLTGRSLRDPGAGSEEAAEPSDGQSSGARSSGSGVRR
jgi:ABC-2 type transport system ATP-binding protein